MALVTTSVALVTTSVALVTTLSWVAGRLEQVCLEGTGCVVKLGRGRGLVSCS